MQQSGPIDDKMAARRAAIQWTAKRGDKAYRTADRHSRAVRALRWVLPVVVVAAGGAFAISLYVGGKSTIMAALPKVDLQNNSLVMDAPRVSGFSNTKRSYEVSAEKATQNLQNPRMVTLDKIDATFGLDGEDKARVKANSGIYDSEAETLRLKDGIRMETAGGYQAKLSEADVNLRTRSLQSSQPVEIKTGDATIRGNAVEISEGGTRIQFSRGVSMTIGGPAASPETPK